ncbi:DNA/RNA non-specific endonuclease [Actinotalea sp. K2]|uniref:DNA/RNA non-specific endonuclease n=1 Tax=Actinotalea sp. K2 TaxID=2939438 RepID=UPI002016CB12|nr:DNA/RNA non-specific endonuclease [Actinotalea sp. K2]MCL3863266.1 DNA/RNA non-specific endonuclease [Actinotalea sp. K2]
MLTRSGYDPTFLPVDVPLPQPAAPTGPRLVELPYTHFTVLLRPDRRLAAATVVMIDGEHLVDLDRTGTRWRLDPRVPGSAQAGAEVYARNDLDRGHLVRRRDPVWGSAETAATANADTFFYTNAAPQVAAFNQSKDLWLGLEDHLLDHAGATASRLTVLTGPVLADDDPTYRGLPLPRAFWKVAAWVRPDGLAATAYLLDQSELLAAFLEADRGEGTSPSGLGAYRTFQVPVDDVARTTGLDLGPLTAADRLLAVDVVLRRAGVREPRGRFELTALDQVVL